MFVVAAKRSAETKDGGLQTFINQQIDAAKAPEKAHVLMRSGTDVTSLDHIDLLTNKTKSIKVTRYHTDPLAIPVKQKHDTYLSTVHFLPELNQEPQLKKSNQADPIASLSIHTPNYSTAPLNTASGKVYEQHSNLEPVLPKSAKRWAIQSRGMNQRSTDSMRIGPNYTNPATLELRTKEELVLYLNNVEKYLESTLNDCLPALMDSILNVN